MPGDVGAHYRVVGRNLADARGERVVLRGVNPMKIFTDKDTAADHRLETLQPGWVTEVALTSPNGIKATAITPKSILERRR